MVSKSRPWCDARAGTQSILLGSLAIAIMAAAVLLSAVAMGADADQTQQPPSEKAQQKTLQQAQIRQDLRLYRVNKDGISDRFWFTRSKARKVGCHSISKRSRLHRAVQFGYSYCRIYARKQCAPESVLAFTRDDEPIPTINLLQGYSWFSVSDHARGERVKSWYCSNDPIPEHDSEAGVN